MMTYFTEDEKSKSMFHLLVKDESDLIGMMGYIKYKQAKSDYIDKHRLSNNNDKPTEEELKRFQNALCEEDTVLHYKKIGQKHLLETFNNMFKEKINEINKELNEKQIEYDKEKDKFNNDKEQFVKKQQELERKEKEYIKRKKDFAKRESYCKAVKPNSFFSGLAQNLLASFIVTFITVIISISLILKTDIISNISDLVVEKINYEEKQ